MKKTWIIILIVLVLALTGFFVFRWFSNQNNTQSGQYDASRTALNENQSNTEIANNIEQNKEPVETELYSFSTNILTNSKNRLTNIKITCSRINETVVKAGKEFSFCDVVGQPSSNDGYKPAEAFGENGKVIQAIGGRKLSSKYNYI